MGLLGSIRTFADCELELDGPEFTSHPALSSSFLTVSNGFFSPTPAFYAQPLHPPACDQDKAPSAAFTSTVAGNTRTLFSFDRNFDCSGPCCHGSSFGIADLRCQFKTISAFLFISIQPFISAADQGCQ